MNELATRITSGIIYLSVIWYGISYSELSFKILFIIIGIRCLYEMYHLRKKKTKIIPFLYIIIPFTLIHGLAFWDSEFNPILVLGLFILTWVFDSFSYLFGVPLGYHKILSTISPKKSWEGFLGGMIATLLTSYIVSINMPYIYQEYSSIWWQITLILPFTATIGDFIESYYKRKANVKDSANLIPGHGGMLDRMDAFTISIPVFYIFIYITSLK